MLSDGVTIETRGRGAESTTNPNHIRRKNAMPVAIIRDSISHSGLARFVY